jgi:hypothetical protein
MSQLFDLNVHNYSLQELLNFFGLATNDDAASVDRTCNALKQKINGDPKLGPVTKGKIHDFLSKAVDRLSQSRHTTTELFTGTSAGTSAGTSTRDKGLAAAMTAAMKATAPAPAPTKFMQLKNEVEEHGDNFLITRPSVQVGIAGDFKNGKSVLTGAPPGIVNPIAMSTIKRALNVDTRFRSNYYTTRSTDFVFNIPYKFENVTSMSVATYELPLTYYAVSQQYENNCIVFQWEETPTGYPNDPAFNMQYTLLIPDGNYNASFQNGNGTPIETAINGILKGTELVKRTGLAYSVDRTSGRSIFACNSATDNAGNPLPHDDAAPAVRTNYIGAMRVVFNVKAVIDRTANSATRGITDFGSSFQNDTRPLPYFLGWQLGFRTAMYEMYGGIDASGNMGMDPSGNHAPQAAVSEGVCLITGPNYVFLCIDDYNNNVNNYYASAFGSSTIAPNIIARLNIKQQVVSAGAFNVISGESLSTSLTYSREYFGPVDIQRIRITLVDDFGRVLDLNNMDWSFALMFECLYSSSAG